MQKGNILIIHLENLIVTLLKDIAVKNKYHITILILYLCRTSVPTYIDGFKKH
jgi:hypothetical protein